MDDDQFRALRQMILEQNVTLAEILTRLRALDRSATERHVEMVEALYPTTRFMDDDIDLPDALRISPLPEPRSGTE